MAGRSEGEGNRQPTLLSYAPPEPLAVPLYRRVLSGALIVAGVVAAVAGAFVAHEPATANVWTAAGGFVVWGLVIRFQHVRR